MKYLTLIALFLLFLPVNGLAKEVKEVDWEALQPQSSFLQKNFDILSEEDQGKVFWVSYLKDNIPAERTASSAALYDELTAELAVALPMAEALNIDIAKSLSELKLMETGINRELSGQHLKIAGYLLPLTSSGKEVQEFLLVPYYGACVHTPPPPLNQIIYARTQKPIPLTDDLVFKAVYLTGILHVNSALSKEVFLGDGTSDIDIGYTMSVDLIEDYKEE